MKTVLNILNKSKENEEIFQGTIEAGGKSTVFEAVGINDSKMISKASGKAINEMTRVMQGMDESGFTYAQHNPASGQEGVGWRCPKQGNSSIRRVECNKFSIV